MVASLLRSTSDLSSHHASSGAARTDAGFADNTRDAIERGCRLALAALVDRSVADAAARLGRATPRLLLTGGAAPELLPYLAQRRRARARPRAARPAVLARPAA